MRIQQLNLLDRPQFVALTGGVYEHSPWVAECAYEHRPFHSREDLALRMNLAVEAASSEQKLTLLRAHPDLGTRAKVSENSANEQAGAGLDKLTAEEYERLLNLNSTYKQKFGFPFLYAVKGSDKFAILEALQQRVERDPEDEFQEALRQVHRIARFRLEALIEH